MSRRLLSILLFWATLLPMIAPMLSTGAMAESSLSACCRRGGKHHCAMSAEERAQMMGEQNDGASKTAGMSAPPEKCPYSQHSLGAVHLQVFTPEATAMHSVIALQEASAAEQAECLRRISFDRSRQKRGPPSLLS
jgi:hypothetical protein